MEKLGLPAGRAGATAGNAGATGDNPADGGGASLNGGVRRSPEDLLYTKDSIRYAAGYQVTVHDGYTSVEVRDPWNEGKLLQRYLLVARDASLPTGMPEGTVVRVPLRKMVVYTSVHCAALDALGVTDDIAGVCESRYINVTAIKERIREGLITDVGEAASPGVEKMIEIGAEVVFASPFDHGSYGPVEKLGIPIIECADYMENDPLGRAEWIKFIGLLTGRSARADSLFRRTEANYLRIKALVGDVAYRPKLMTGMKYGSSWYVPSGGSFMARIYKDAGADCLFGYLSGAGSTPLSFETVLNKAIHADIWLVYYNREDEMTYGALQSEYSSYSRFDAFRDRHIYGCNTNYSLYYEEVPMHPDYLLAELIAIFHPQILPDHKFRYFAPLGDETDKKTDR
jgi:iron complex transport system substrate-binding protein